MMDLMISEVKEIHCRRNLFATFESFLPSQTSVSERLELNPYNTLTECISICKSVSYDCEAYCFSIIF